MSIATGTAISMPSLGYLQAGVSKMKQQAISLDTAVELATVSRRTLWRRVQEGKLARAGADERGRALLVLRDVQPFLSIQLTNAADEKVLLAADQGDSNAQNELGILCLEQQLPTPALHWFEQAAEQGNADAMHHLGRLYLQGFESSGGGCVPQDRSLAFVWLSKAALYGHLIAQEQLSVWTHS